MDSLRSSQDFLQEEFTLKPHVAWQVRSSDSEIKRCMEGEQMAPVVANPEEKIEPVSEETSSSGKV